MPGRLVEHLRNNVKNAKTNKAPIYHNKFDYHMEVNFSQENLQTKIIVNDDDIIMLERIKGHKVLYLTVYDHNMLFVRFQPRIDFPT